MSGGGGLWTTSSNIAPVSNSKVAEVPTSTMLCGTGEVVSDCRLGSAQPSKLKLLGLTLGVVLTFHLGSPSQRPVESDVQYNVSQ